MQHQTSFRLKEFASKHKHESWHGDSHTFSQLGCEHFSEDRAVGSQDCPVHRNALPVHHQNGICEKAFLQHVLACPSQTTVQVTDVVVVLHLSYGMLMDKLQADTTTVINCPLWARRVSHATPKLTALLLSMRKAVCQLGDTSVASRNTRDMCALTVGLLCRQSLKKASKQASKQSSQQASKQSLMLWQHAPKLDAMAAVIKDATATCSKA